MRSCGWLGGVGGTEGVDELLDGGEGVAIGEGFDEGVEVVLGEPDLQEGTLPDLVDGVGEVILYFQGAYRCFIVNIKTRQVNIWTKIDK